MADPVTLLPPNRTPRETAHDLADAARALLVDPDDVRRAKDPLLCDASFLPVLAWERSVDVWISEWSESKKREVVNAWYDYERLKGTKEGLKRFVELAGGVVRRIDTAPLMAFPSRDMTTEERIAWLSRFKQIRTFKYRNRGSKPFAFYTTGRGTPVVFNETHQAKQQYFATVNGFEYYGRRSFLWEKGVETPLNQWERTVTEQDKSTDTYQRIVLPAKLDNRWFLDRQMPRLFTASADPVAERTVAVQYDRVDYKDHNEYFTSRTIVPGLRKILIKPENVSENGTARPGDFYLDHPKAKIYLTEGNAELYVYERLYLHERADGPLPSPPDARMFLGHAYYQFPHRTALAKVEVTGKLPIYAFNRYMRGYFYEPDLSKLNHIVDAARASKSARTKVLLNTQTHDTVRSSNRLLAGQATCGAQVRI